MSVFSPLTQQRCPSYSKLTESIRKHTREWPRVAADPREGFSNAGMLWGPGWQLCDRKQILCSQSWDLLPLQVTWEEPRWWCLSHSPRGPRACSIRSVEIHTALASSPRVLQLVDRPAEAFLFFHPRAVTLRSLGTGLW